MSENSPNLALPYLLAAQAQKHVTHNEALRILDGLVQLSVLEARASPPGSPAAGARYLVTATASGLWEGWEASVALWDDTAWRRLVPQEGWFLWNVAAEEFQYFDGAAWQSMNLADFASGEIEALGVATSADETNRLAVASPASLLTHAGAGHQLKVNKASEGDTASVLFQSDWSGRAEMGLAGDDDFSFKVSPNGAAWETALRIDRATGRVTTPAGRRDAISGARIAEILWTPGADGVTSFFYWGTASSYTHGENPRTAIIGSISGDTITITTTDAQSIFGQWFGFMEGVSYLRIWNLTRSPVQSAWIRARPSNNTIAVLDATAIANWLPGDTIQIGDPVSRTPNRVIAVDVSPMMQQVFGTVFPQTGMIIRGQFHGSAGDRLEITPTGLGGSFVQVATSIGAGAFTASGTTFIPCTEPSPISNSNLLFVREVINTTATVSAISCIALTV